MLALALTTLALAVTARAVGPEAAHGRAASGSSCAARTPSSTSPCPGGLCIALSGGAFRGTPVGTGAYTGSDRARLADAFPNGEGGVCAPVAGTITLGAGTPDRLDLAVAGDSCQDGAGDPDAVLVHRHRPLHGIYGTGAYAHAYGTASRRSSRTPPTTRTLTLIGRIRH